MVNFIADFWYVWVLVCVLSLGYYLYERYRRRNEVEAQFIVTGTLIGCLMVIFYGAGILSFLFTIIATLKKLL